MEEGAAVPEPTSAFPEDKKVEPMVALLKEVAPGVDPAGLGFGQLRDELLKVAPLDLQHVKRCNAAVGLYSLNPVDPQLESAWFQPLNL